MTAAPVSTAQGIESAAAANDLFERYHDRVYAFCMSRTRNPTDADDATQTAFMHALNGLRRGVVPQFELTWLLRIAENVCHSMHRRAYRRYERDELPADVISREEDVTLITEQYETLCGALESLPDQQRRAILLREWRGLSYDDIADELGVSHAAVETMLFRARRSLVKQLGSLAVFPFPAIGRFVQWIAGSAGVKAAAVAAVTIGSATAVVSSTPAAAQRPARAELPSVSTPTPGTDRYAVPFERPAAIKPARAREAATGFIPADPPLVTAAEEPLPSPVSPIEPGAESTTSDPIGVAVDLPAVLPLPAAPAETTEALTTIVELADDVVDVPQIELPSVQIELPPVEIELPPVVPGLPLP